MNDTKPSLAPCGHPKSQYWEGCDRCAADFVDRRGGHPLGRHQLLGVGIGLAFDLHDDGRVIAYMLHADTVAGDSGGWWSAWITHDEWISQSADVEIAAPVLYMLPGQTAEELANFCELVSGLATALRPVVSRAIALDVPQALYAELLRMLDGLEAGAQTCRLVIRVVQLLVFALMTREDRETGQ